MHELPIWSQSMSSSFDLSFMHHVDSSKVPMSRVRPSSLLLDDFPIRLMDHNVLSCTSEPGLVCRMLCCNHIDQYNLELDYYRIDIPSTAGLRKPAMLGWLSEFCGDSFPSRNVLITDIGVMDSTSLLKRRDCIRALMHGSTSTTTIIRFYDLRDAIELFIDMVGHVSVHFVDESIIPCLYQVGWTDDIKWPGNSNVANNNGTLSLGNNGCVCLSMNYGGKFVTESWIKNHIDDMINILSAFGKILAHSEGWRDVSAGETIVKIFVEFYDCFAAENAYQKMKLISISEEYAIQAEFCSLHNQDKEYLFFQPSTATSKVDSAPATPTSLPSEARAVRRPGRHHQNLSTISNAFSCLTVLSETELNGTEQVKNYQSGNFASDNESVGNERQLRVVHGNKVEIERIEAGLDKRTTCMIKNIPNKYTQQMLIDHLDETHTGRYDFVYLRMDFKNKCNVGYAFINFLHPSDIVSFAQRMLGRRWPKFKSEKRCELAYARIQGKQALIDKFRNSRVMQEPPSYRPRVFDRSTAF